MNDKQNERYMNIKYSNKRYIKLDLFFSKMKKIYLKYFDVLAYKMEKIAELYDNSAYDKYQKEKKLLDIVNAKNILHVGCGSYPATAIALTRISNANIVSIDKDPTVIENAKRIVNKKNLGKKITIDLGDIIDYPIKNFDVIISRGIIYPKEKILKHLFEAAEPQTKIILSFSGFQYKFIFKNITLPDNIIISNKIKTNWTVLEVLFGINNLSYPKTLLVSFIKK